MLSLTSLLAAPVTPFETFNKAPLKSPLAMLPKASTSPLSRLLIAASMRSPPMLFQTPFAAPLILSKAPPIPSLKNVLMPLPRAPPTLSEKFVIVLQAFQILSTIDFTLYVTSVTISVIADLMSFFMSPVNSLTTQPILSSHRDFMPDPAIAIASAAPSPASAAAYDTPGIASTTSFRAFVEVSAAFIRGIMFKPASPKTFIASLALSASLGSCPIACMTLYIPWRPVSPVAFSILYRAVANQSTPMPFIPRICMAVEALVSSSTDTDALQAVSDKLPSSFMPDIMLLAPRYAPAAARAGPSMLFIDPAADAAPFLIDENAPAVLSTAFIFI